MKTTTKQLGKECGCSCHSIKLGWCNTCCWNHINKMKTQKDKPQEKWNQTCGKRGHPCHECLALNLIELIRDEIIDEKQIRQEAIREMITDTLRWSEKEVGKRCAKSDFIYKKLSEQRKRLEALLSQV